MDLSRAGPISGPVVTGFRGAAIVVDGIARTGGVILTPLAARDWDGADFGEAADLDPLPEFILLGTGATLVRPDPRLVAAWEAKGVGLEPMDTRAAARAWAVLRAEGRWVTAALKAIA